MPRVIKGIQFLDRICTCSSQGRRGSPGGCLVPALRGARHEARALARDPSTADPLSAVGVVRADLLEPGTPNAAFEGIDAAHSRLPSVTTSRSVTRTRPDRPGTPRAPRGSTESSPSASTATPSRRTGVPGATGGGPLESRLRPDAVRHRRREAAGTRARDDSPDTPGRPSANRAGSRRPGTTASRPGGGGGD